MHGETGEPHSASQGTFGEHRPTPAETARDQRSAAGLPEGCRAVRATFSSARDARKALAPLGLGPGLKEGVELIVSELATNAVLHAGGPPFSLRVSYDGRWARVEVGDGSAQLPVMGPPGGLSGRGLHIVDRLATTWGFDRTATGKVVWAELERPRAQKRRRQGN